MTTFAHSKNNAGLRQGLQDHLEQVAHLATQFATAMGAADLAYYAGLLHDIGKFNPAFQHYLLEAEARPSVKMHGRDHKGAGAVLAAMMNLEPLTFLIKGHHGGLPSAAELKEWLQDCKGRSEVHAAIETAKHALPALQCTPAGLLPQHIGTEYEAELFIRLLFSALVDADFLDTERHFQLGRSAGRGSNGDLATMMLQFEEDQRRRFEGCPDTPVNRIRRRVYQDCLRAATLAPGFFRLTVPTGGAKTRSSLAFALAHAQRYQLERIIYAIPYMSITEQTAREFRGIFPTKDIVLEHHSSITPPEDPDNLTRQELWSRLAAENWDARLIVTTTVQLFESLMAHTPSACRKLHNSAGSVIILDEVQMLPTHLLAPILDVLRQMVAHYGVTVVLCTATQPALYNRDRFEGLDGIREIVADAQELFALLRRVEYHFPCRRGKWSWQEVAARIRNHHQSLTIVNTRADAIKLLDALDLPDDPALFHLSTRMCGAHRRLTLEVVRQRLKAGNACHLISTQVIEAGVDVDFPCVLRAIAPLDRIVQAAGRCNREGKLPAGQVIVFEPEDGGLPPGPYRTGTQTTLALLQSLDIDLHDCDLPISLSFSLTHIASNGWLLKPIESYL
jgi:CRISPR-associated endonuclease/helicase Cas3